MRFPLMIAVLLTSATCVSAGFGHHRAAPICVGCQPVYAQPATFYQPPPVAVVRQQIIWEPRVIQTPGVMVPRVYPTPLRNLFFGREQFVPTCPNGNCGPAPATATPVEQASPSVLAPKE